MHRLCIDDSGGCHRDGVAVVTRSYSVHNLYLPLKERTVSRTSDCKPQFQKSHPIQNFQVETIICPQKSGEIVADLLYTIRDPDHRII